MVKITFQDHCGEVNVFWSKETEKDIKKLPNFNDKVEGYFLTKCDLEQALREAFEAGGDITRQIERGDDVRPVDRYLKSLGLKNN